MEGSKIDSDTKKPALKPWQERLEQGRLAAGWTLKDLAQQLGVSLQNVSQVEKGRQSMTVERLLDTCAALNLRTEWVLHGTGRQFVGSPPTPTGKPRPANAPNYHHLRS